MEMSITNNCHQKGIKRKSKLIKRRQTEAEGGKFFKWNSLLCLLIRFGRFICSHFGHISHFSIFTAASIFHQKIIFPFSGDTMYLIEPMGEGGWR
jgi:hypothetical protein